MWLVAAPVLVLAWLEAVLGLAQFFFMRMAGPNAASVTGTYVNYDHFAGLLEMSFPLAIVGALSTRDPLARIPAALRDRKSTRLNSSHANISYAVFCLKKKH